MPRFKIRTLLIAFAVVAVWLATSCVTEPTLIALGIEIRKSILLLMFLASVFAAIFHKGRIRAYWSGFAVMMLLNMNINFISNKFIPNLDHSSALVRNFLLQKYKLTTETAYFVELNLEVLLLLALCSLSGFISAWIYEHAKGNPNG